MQVKLPKCPRCGTKLVFEWVYRRDVTKDLKSKKIIKHYLIPTLKCPKCGLTFELVGNYFYSLEVNI